jgi:transmembrane sensor
LSWFTEILNMKGEDIFQEYIVRYLDGSATEEETILLLDWLKKDKQHMRMFSETRDLWTYTRHSGSKDTSPEQALHRLKTRITQSVPQKDNVKVLFPHLQEIYKIAVIAAIVLFTGLVLYNVVTPHLKMPSAYNETIIPVGQKGKLILADGTRVWLNSGTSIRYSSAFGNKDREIYLEGEAYFDVAHDKNKPFLVHSGMITVKVLGTSFNLKAYPDEKRVETTLIRGSVKILETNGKNYVELTTLKPNEQAIYQTNTRQLHVSELSAGEHEKINSSKTHFNALRASTQDATPRVESIIQWKDQKLIFDNESLEQMAIKLERWYGKNIHIESEDLKKSRYSGKFIYNETIYQVLEVISLTTDINYYEKDHEIYIKSK